MSKTEAALGVIKAIADAIGILVKAGLVSRDSSHMLRWIGPAW